MTGFTNRHSDARWHAICSPFITPGSPSSPDTNSASQASCTPGRTDPSLVKPSPCGSAINKHFIYTALSTLASSSKLRLTAPTAG